MQTAQVQPPNQAGDGAWKVLAVVGVLGVGGLFGTVVAVTAFGNRGGQASAPTEAKTVTRSSFEDAFDASFKASCQSSAMRSNVSRATAENYCSCALPVFHKTHDMRKTALECRKYLVR
jgi:hypothetical protein